MDSVYINNRFMEKGFTTGTCAAAAAYGATAMLLSGIDMEYVYITTPDGTRLSLELLDTKRGSDYVSCAVRKQSGDDPDITNGMLIYGKAEYGAEGIEIKGGIGIGKVTEEGLAVPIGFAAINPMPLKAIEKSIVRACGEAEYTGGIKMTIYAPEGKEIAKKTLNPHLGIKGGISILGTTGIVEPMSRKAFEDTIRLEMNRLALRHSYAVAVPGNYGRDFALNMGLPSELIVKTGNFIGAALDIAAEKRLKGILIVSHMGKAVKLGAGIMNTHSHEGDGRMEVLCTAALKAGCPKSELLKIADCVTTDQAFEILRASDCADKTMEIIAEKILYYISRRADINAGCIVFSNKYGIIGKTENADSLIDEIMKEVI